MDIVDAAPMPSGYVLEVTPQRTFKHRSLWNVRVLDDAGNRLWGRAFYNPAAGIVAAQKWAWERVPMTVTTDDEGYITSMEPTDA